MTLESIKSGCAQFTFTAFTPVSKYMRCRLTLLIHSSNTSNHLLYDAAPEMSEF